MKRPFITILIVLTSFIMLPALSQAQVKKDFHFNANINGPLKANALYNLHLDESILNKCLNVLCADIRIVDDNGIEIPYVILKNTKPVKTHRNYFIKPTNLIEEEGSMTIEMKMPEKSEPVNRLNLTVSNNNFKRKTLLQGSNDGKNWKTLGEDVIYDFNPRIRLRKTTIEFPLTDSRYLRLTIQDEPKEIETKKSITLKYEGLEFITGETMKNKLRIGGITATNNVKATKSTVYDEVEFTNFTTKLDKEKNTVITLETGLPWERIYFDISNPYYFRTLKAFYSDTGEDGSYMPMPQSQIFSFPISDRDESKNYIKCENRRERFYKFIMINNDNPPIKIKGIRLRWERQNLFFVAINDSAQYSLLYGNDAIGRANYDLSNFINQQNWFDQSYTAVSTSPVKQNLAYTSQKASDERRLNLEKTILTIVVIVLMIILGFWLYKLTKNMPE